MPADGWGDTAALLTSTGKPWPDQAAITDLRWHVDQGRSLPGRPTLARRWNWPDRRVRALLADPERWWDPVRGPAPASREEIRPASVQPVSSERPASVPLAVESPAFNRVERPASVQPVSSERPAGVHRRVDPPSPSPSPSPEKTDVAPAGEGGQLNLIAGVSGEEKPSQPDRYEEAARYFGQIVHLQINRRPSFGPDRKSKLGQKLERAVKKDAELVLDAMRYVAEGQGERAVFLRTKYAADITVQTVLAHVEEYAELWRAEQDTEHRPPVPGQAGLAKRGPALSAEERQRIADDFALNGFGGE